MLRLAVKLGDAVHIEGVGTIHIEEKSGRSVRLAFETKLGPIRIIKRDETEYGVTRRQQHMV